MLINRSIYNQFKKSCCTSCHKYFITTFTQSLQQQPQKMCISADMKISEYFIPYWYQVLVRLYFKFLFFFYVCFNTIKLPNKYNDETDDDFFL